MDFTLLQTLYVFLATFVGESFGTMFGGGSFFIQPALLAAHVPSNLAVANDVTAAAFSSLTFLYAVRKQKRQVHNTQIKQIIGLMAPASIAGAVIGSHIMAAIPESTLRMMILGICSIGLVYTFLKVSQPTAATASTFIPGWPLLAFLAALGLGMYDGISGAGSGILIILTLSLIFRTDMKMTLFLANILSVISLSTAGITFFFLGLLSWQLLAVMVPACILAGLVAGKLSILLPEKLLRLTYGCLVLALMAYLVYGMLA